VYPSRVHGGCHDGGIGKLTELIRFAWIRRWAARGRAGFKTGAYFKYSFVSSLHPEAGGDWGTTSRDLQSGPPLCL